MAFAPNVFNSLKGIFCIYKPAGSSMKNVIHTLRNRLAKDLNSMEQRPLRSQLMYTNDSNTSQPVVRDVPDLADHILVVGPRYLPGDFHFAYSGYMNAFSSGVTVMAVGGFKTLLRQISDDQQLSVYHVKGLLGRATDNFTTDGTLLQKTTYNHVTQAKIDRVLAAMEAGHHKNIYVSSGIDLQSQEAYELAAQGMLKSTNKEAGPVIYCLKCIDFQPPHFTLEIHAVNEDSDFLLTMVHNIGTTLKTTAACSQIRRLRYGSFDLSSALLQKHWQGETIIDNIAHCRGLIPDFTFPTIEQQLEGLS